MYRIHTMYTFKVSTYICISTRKRTWGVERRRDVPRTVRKFENIEGQRGNNFVCMYVRMYVNVCTYDTCKYVYSEISISPGQHPVPKMTPEAMTRPADWWAHSTYADQTAFENAGTANIELNSANIIQWPHLFMQWVRKWILMYIYMYVYLSIYIHNYLIYIFRYIYIYVYIYTYVYVCVYTCIHMNNMYVLRVQMYIHKCMYAHICMSATWLTSSL